MQHFQKEEAKQYLLSLPDYTKFDCFHLNNTDTKRAKKENDDSYFVFLKGKKRYGYRYPLSAFLEMYGVIEKADADKTAQWHRRLRRAIKLMKESGLWLDLVPKYEKYLAMTWEDLTELRNLYWSIQSTVRDVSVADRVKAYQPYADKYPWAFSYDSTGDLKLIWDLMTEITDCKLKSMYFGKYDNRRIKDEIQRAIAEKRAYSRDRLEVKYDVSFSYDPERGKAWYSEEYRGCGNGHYYIALNHSTALFCEDD